MSSDEENERSESSSPSCEISGCTEEAYEYTECCHVPLCEEHLDDKEIYSEACSVCGGMICWLCSERNPYFYCDSCGKKLCPEHNEEKYHCDC